MDYQGCVVSDFLDANGYVVLERVGNNYNLRSFTQKQIEEITNGYSSVLGEGAVGKVYKGKLDDLRPVAVKRYKNGTKTAEFAKEVIVHSQINHKNVVKLLGCCTEENALTIVMEFICNGSLYDTLHCSNANGHFPFPLEKRLEIAIESAEVLSCMHSMYSPVLHGDIKTANILLDENLRPKISDFAVARFLSADAREDQHTRSVIGCTGYMDPLFCQSGILSPKSDVYSFGVVLLEIITRKKAVDGDIILAQSFSEVLRKGKKVRLMFDEEIANDKKNMTLLEDIAKVAAECLKMEVKMRPEMVEVADSLRAIRKVLQQRKGISSTGSKFGFLGIGKAKDVLSTISPTPFNDTNKTSSSVVPTISMDELKKITMNFTNGALIGEGSYNNVYLGVLKDGQKSAIKRPKHTKETILEVSDILRFRHANVIQLLGFCAEGHNRVLVYEYTSRGSLHDILHGKNNVRGDQQGHVLSWVQRVKIAICAATGLEFLHEKAQPHCGIKTSNIFLFDNDVAKIGGLRASRQADDYSENLVLDRPYNPLNAGYDAPEYQMEEGQLNTKSDVYSFGVVLLELLTGRKALDRSLPLGEQYLVWVAPRLLKKKIHQYVDQRLEGHYPRKAVAKLAAIAELCIHYDMDSRPNMSTVVSALRPLLLDSSSNLPSAAS